MRALVWFVAAALVVGAATPVAAQESTGREGLWGSFGVGGGWNLARNIADETKPGFAGYVRLGWAVDRHVLFGGEGMLWAREEANQVLTRGNVTLTGLYYPAASRGIFLKLSLGLSLVDFFPTTDSTVVTTETGFGSNIALGYDLRISRSLFITPNVDFVYQRIENADNTMLLLTLGLTFQ